MIVHTRFLALALVLGLGTATSAAAEDWAQFLGPQRNGISAETGLIDRIPPAGPTRLWSVEGGVGMAGIAVRGDLAITMVQKNGEQFALAIDAEKGSVRWQTAIAAEYRNQMGDGPRATPVIHEHRVFVYSGQGVLAALNAADGRLLWKADLVGRLKAKPADYGMASSPLVVNGQVIVTVGGAAGTVVACDVASGQVKWASGSAAAAYSSPALVRVGGADQVVAFHGGGVEAFDPSDGASRWRYEFTTDYDCNIAQPIMTTDGLFISAGENHGCVLLDIAGSKVTEKWASLGSKSTLRSEWQTPILIDGHLYGMDNVGSAGPVTHLTCIEAKTGRRIWRETRFGKGNLIAADGKLFVVTMKGELVLVRDPGKYEELGRAAVIGRTRQAPSLANGRLYLRDDRQIVCLDVRKS